jgi:serine phosphatase RsbU (regulator of sigma subunit)
MTTASAAPASVIEWGVAGRGLELQSGDLHVVLPFADGALVALIDGLGHGPQAAMAARAAATVLAMEPGASIQELMQRCHDDLRKTRGAAMTVASFDARAVTMSWCAVGNVDAALLRAAGGRWTAHAAVLLRGGVVGYQLPPLRVDTHPVRPGDMLVMATDGIRSGFTDSLDMNMPPAEAAHAILLRFGKTTDDAHVLVVRYVGSAA